MSISAPKLVANQKPQLITPKQTLRSLSPDSAALQKLHHQLSNSQSPLSSQIRNTESFAQTQASQDKRKVSHPHRRLRQDGIPLLPNRATENEEINEAEAGDISPTDGRDVQIMFHGREIFAQDLIGLRVAKTFADHGRFMGQVVKFDNQKSLYTVVYADGDAEDLTIDLTLQILIQDEIERIDTAQPPPAISLLRTKNEDISAPVSPDTGDFVTSVPVRRAQIQVSEREAHFVTSLFEIHALPNLVRQGWRVQSNPSGRGHMRYISSSGESFASPLEVVGHIALDNELLRTCFPSNVHSAILSLLPHDETNNSTDVNSHFASSKRELRKHATSDSPRIKYFDSKRPRRAWEYMGANLSLSGRAGLSTDRPLYRDDVLDYRAQASSRLAAYRGQVMDGRIRLLGGRFLDDEVTSQVRYEAPPDFREYRHAVNSDVPRENRWAGANVVPGIDSTEHAHRLVSSPDWCERGTMLESKCLSEAPSDARMRAEGRYMYRVNAPNSIESSEGEGVARMQTGCYQDSSGPCCGSPGLIYPQYDTMRARASDGTRLSYNSRTTASFMSPMDTFGAAISMVDVDRNFTLRPGNVTADQPRGRSPRQSGAQPMYQQQQIHRRSSSSHSYHNQQETLRHYSSEPIREVRKDSNLTGSVLRSSH